MFKQIIFKVFLAITILLSTTWLYSALAYNPSPSEAEQNHLPEGYAVPVTSPPGSHTWDSDADFVAGQFDQAEVVPDTGRVTPARQWTSNVKVNDDTGTRYQSSPSLAVDASGTFYAVWQDFRNGNYDIYFARSTDNGATWSSNVKVSDDLGSRVQGDPSLAVDANGTLYVAWDESFNNDYDIYVTTSTDGGQSWSANIKVNDDSGTSRQQYSSLAVDASGIVYVAWQDQRNGNYDVYFATSTDSGTTWSTNVKVNDDSGTSAQYKPSLAVDASGTVYVAWEDNRNSNYDIYFASSTDSGTTWSTDVKVNDETDSADQLVANLAVDSSGMLYVTWHNGNRDIYFATSTDGGTTWSSNIKFNDDSGASRQEYPSLAVDANGIVYVTWQDNRNGNYDIYFAKSVDDGNHWQVQAMVNDNNGESQLPKPSLAVNANGNAVIAWTDKRNGFEDIYAAYWPDKAQVYSEGTYTSDAYDADDLVAWNELNWTATLPASSAITLTVRVGNSATPDINWSDWYTFTTSPADLGTLPASRYVQWRAHLSTPTSTNVPSLDAVTLTWNGHAHTNVGGFITSDTTWRVADNPHLVTSNVLLGSDATLTIEPGTEILFGDKRALVVEGTLMAQGTASEPITFTSWHINRQRGDWNNLLFSDSSVDALFDANGNYVSGSILQYAVIEYAGGDSTEYAVDAKDTGPFVDHSTIRHHDAGGVRVAGEGNFITHNMISHNTGIALFNGRGNKATIAFNTINGNARSGLYNSGSEVTIHNNTISDNSYRGLENRGSKVTIHNNTISGNFVNNSGGGLYNGNSEVTIYDNTISGNSASNNGGGLYISGSNVIIHDNIISANSTNRNGGGIFGAGIIYNNTVSNNSAVQNGSGIYWSGSGTLAYNSIINNTISDSGETGGVYVNSGYPTIRGNTIQDNDGYQLYNNNAYGDTHLDVRYNWWGTTNNGAIEDAFFDWRDDNSKSIVDYEPFLSESALPPTLSVSPGSLSFIAARGELPTSQRLTIAIDNSNTNPIPTDWNLSSDVNWLALKPVSGEINGSGSVEVVVEVNRTFSSDSIQQGTITIHAPGAQNSPQIIDVTFTVGTPPTPTNTPTASQTPATTPTASRTPTPRATSTPSRTPMPSNTPMPSSTSMPSPTSTPSPMPTPVLDPQEPNDSCQQAQPIATDGSVQLHRFQTLGDVDWVTFEAISGITYLIEAQTPSDSSADVAIALYDACKTLPTENQDNNFSPDVRLQLQAPTTGTYYLRLNNHNPDAVSAEMSYNLSVRALDDNPTPGALIVVGGRLRANDPLQSNIYNVTNEVYKLFLANAYEDERIYYLANDLNLDANQDGLPDVDASATKKNLELAITQWALDKVGRDRALTLYLMGHGTHDKFYLSGRTQTVSPDELDSWLDTLEAAVPGLRVNIIMEACHSGSVIDLNKSVSKPGRVVIASTGARRVAYASSNGAVFSHAFLSALKRGMSLYNAFEEGKWTAQEVHPDQTAWLDDDGDAVPNESEDGQQAQRRGFAYAGTFNSQEQWPPYIMWAKGPEQMEDGKGLIEAEVRDDQGVLSVWGVVYKPSYTPPDAEETEEMPQENLPTVTLLDTDGDGVYSAPYEGFNESGQYRIVVYAVDEDGLVGRPKELIVQTAGQLYLPMVIR